VIRRALFALIALALAAAVVAGCGGDDGDGNQDATPAAETSGDAMEDDGDAMKDDDDAMKDDGAMKDDQEAVTTDAAMSAKRKRGAVVKVVGSDFGRVVADRRGEAFYLFDKEQGKRSRCYGACAAAWPPVLTKGKPRAGKGAKAKLLGTTRRRNGKRQVTYKGHPLYYYVDDEPGVILCQNVDEFGGLWLVVRPNGNAVRG
jgi:predicted lipoprotein with Yx(FWY)xxD motif